MMSHTAHIARLALENTDLSCAQMEIQNMVYALGGVKSVYGLSAGEVALYLLLLIEEKR